MTLLCRECLGQISMEAVNCPHCGAPQPARLPVTPGPGESQAAPEHLPPPSSPASKTKRGIYLAIGLTLCFLILAGLGLWQMQKQGETSPSTVLTALAHFHRTPTANFLSRHQSAVYAVAYSPDGKTLASGSSDRTIILWDLDARQPLAELVLEAAVACLAFSPDGKTLAAGTWDKHIILYDVQTRKPIGGPLTGHTDTIYYVAFSPDGKTLASTSGDARIIFWDFATGNALGQPLTGHRHWVASLAFSPDGKMLASAGGDGTIILWDATTRQRLGPPLQAHKGPVLSLAFRADGEILASGGDDKTVILWDMKIRKPRLKLPNPDSAVLSVAFSPDGKTLAAGTLADTIILWEDPAGQPRASRLEKHQAAVLSLAFSPDGKTLASAGQDKTILLWHLAETSWLTRAYHTLTQEWRRPAAGLPYHKTSQGPKQDDDKTEMAIK